VSTPRQVLLLWEIPHQPELPKATRQRCSELLSQMLLAAVNTSTQNIEEMDDEREDSIDSH
jgi:DNA-binding protein YbaB